MRRREALAIVAGAPVAWPLVARAQQKAMPVIGSLSGGSPDPGLPKALRLTVPQSLLQRADEVIE